MPFRWGGSIEINARWKCTSTASFFRSFCGENLMLILVVILQFKNSFQMQMRVVPRSENLVPFVNFWLFGKTEMESETATFLRCGCKCEKSYVLFLQHLTKLRRERKAAVRFTGRPSTASFCILGCWLAAEQSVGGNLLRSHRVQWSSHNHLINTVHSQNIAQQGHQANLWKITEVVKSRENTTGALKQKWSFSEGFATAIPEYMNQFLW